MTCQHADSEPRARTAALDAALSDARVPRFTIGQAAELVGVRPWFLRRLDALDVVKPTRSGGDQRRYSREQLGQVAEARALMSDGVSARGVRRVLELQARIERLEEELDRVRSRPKQRPPRPSRS